MSLRRIEIYNFKSLRQVKLKNLDNSVASLMYGVNSAGKSNILDAIKYFFEVMRDTTNASNVLDNSNPYTNSMRIKMEFSIAELYKLEETDQINKYKKCLNKYLRRNERVNPHFFIIPMSSNHLSKDSITLELTQYKSGKIKWYPDDSELRKIILKVFPLVFIDTRNMDVNNWDSLWNTISEISKSGLNNTDEDHRDFLRNLINELYGNKGVKSSEIISNELFKRNLEIFNHNYSDRFKAILVSMYGGDQFTLDGQHMSYYSAGLNSSTYIELVLSLVPQLSKLRWKNPIIIIDEIEIGLHPQKIIELSKTLEHFSENRIDLIISTHSPALLSRLVKSRHRVNLYNICYSDLETKIKKIQRLTEEKFKPLLTVNEANLLFSKLAVFVEGLSELQLLNNPHIIDLYPFLDMIDIISFDGNNSRLKVIIPNLDMSNIKHAIIVDGDKILQPRIVDTQNAQNNTIKFSFRKDPLTNPFSNKSIQNRELLADNRKGEFQNIIKLGKSIRETFKQSQFSIDKASYTIIGNQFQTEWDNINNYCNYYNYFPVTTTVEGLLVNSCSYEIVLKWLKSKNETLARKISDKLLLQNDDPYYKTQCLRVLLHGKYDVLLTIKEFKNMFNEIAKSFNEEVRKLQESTCRTISNKTDGWINSFLDYYFNIECSGLTADNIKDKFEIDFPELNQLLKKIQYML